MTRLLLTLLALLTGLAAQTVPAQSRICATSGAEVAVELPAIGKIVAHASKIASKPRSSIDVPVRQSGFVTPQLAVFVPPVLIGIDRARE
jgi:hypothetical protein